MEQTKGCDKGCWAAFHYTQGHHRTDCALTIALGKQVDDLNDNQVNEAQQALFNPTKPALALGEE